LNAVFADTGFWIALLNPRDELHEKARRVSESLGTASVVTSEMVLAELLNDFGARGESLKAAACTLVEQLARNANTAIVPQTDQQFQAALAVYGHRKDKPWGLTDCASQLIMQAHGIRDALTYDRHFEQMGFRALLREA
jgi:predicted nucleic acid-binding protein